MSASGGNRSFGVLVMAVLATAFVSHQAEPASASRGPAPGAAAASTVTMRVAEAFVVDTPPRPPAVPVAAEGWPFQQLPRVAKFGVPESPRAGLAPIPPFVPVITPPFAVTPRTPPVIAEPGGASPLWLLAPLAVGVAVADVAGPGSVIPEPSSVILLATGVALLGLKSRLRRPRGRRPR